MGESRLIEIILLIASELSRPPILFFSILNSPQDTPSGQLVDGLWDGLVYRMAATLFTKMAGNILCPHREAGEPGWLFARVCKFKT